LYGGVGSVRSPPVASMYAGGLPGTLSTGTHQRAAAMGYDITLTEDPARPGKVLVHRPDCPAVATARAAGEPLCTLLCIEKPLDRRFKRHTCLDMEPSCAG